jgi:lipopolysaccharide export system permease protein
MTILFRHVLREFLKPFIFCLLACAAIWVIIDLFGSIDDFLDNKAPASVIFFYYFNQVPRLLQQVVPAAFLFSTLFTLLTLSRRQEWTAMQAAGFSPWKAFLPLAFSALALTVLLLWVGCSLAAQAETARTTAKRKLKGQPAHLVEYNALVYRSAADHRTWFLGSIHLDTGEATDVELLQQTDDGRDAEKYFAARATWTGQGWILRNVRQVSYKDTGEVASERVLPEIPLPAVTTDPHDMIRELPEPDTLTVVELWQWLDRLHAEPAIVRAPYATQLQQAIAYPFTVLVFLAYAISFGARNERSSATAGVFNAIFVLLAYLFVMSFFLQMGRSHRLPAFIAAWATPFLFGTGAFAVVAWSTGEAWKFKADLRTWWNLVRYRDPEAS